MKKIYLSILGVILSIGMYAQMLNGLYVCGVVTNLSPNTINVVNMTVYSGSTAQNYSVTLSSNAQFCLPVATIGVDSNGVQNYTLALSVNTCAPIYQSGVYTPSSANLSVTLQGCGASSNCSTTIGAMPLLGTTLSTLTASCTGVSPYTYVWATGQTTQTINTNLQSNYYSVTAIDASGCSSTAYYIDTVVSNCYVTIQLPANGGNTLTAIGNNIGTAPYVYSWSVNGIAINTSNSNTITAQGSGTYCVTSSDAVGCAATDCAYFNNGSTSNNCSVQFYSYPDSTVNPANPNTGLVYFSSNPSGVAPYTYSWLFSDGTTSNIANPSHLFLQTGATVNWATLTVVDANGCVSSYSQQVATIAFISLCNTYFDSYSNYTASAPGEIIFQNMSYSLSSNATYSWDFGDGSPLSTVVNPTHVYTTNGNYYVCLTVTGGGCISTYCQTSYIDLSWWTNNPFTSANCNAGYILSNAANANGVITLVDISQAAGGSYSWNVSNGSTSNSTTPFFTLNGIGSYVICLTITDSTGACSSTFCDTLTVDSLGDVSRSNSTFNGVIGVNVVASAKPLSFTGVKNILDSSTELALLPNPATNFVTLKIFTEKAENATINVVDVSGKLVKEIKLNTNRGTNNAGFDVSDMSNGIYFVKVISNTKTETIKLSVKH